MKRTESIGPKERQALVYLDHTVQSTGLIPSQWAIARAVGISLKGSIGRMPTFQARYHQLFGEAKGCKEANAIACLDRILAATGVTPTKAEIGRAIGANGESLGRRKVFAARYRAALSRYRPKVRPRSKAPEAQTDDAIAFLDATIRATGRRPSLSEIARFVRADPKTLLRHPRFAANWRTALAYKRRASPGSRNSYKATLEDQAIELLNALVESAGIRPSLRTIARQLKTSHAALLNRPRFMALWQAAKMRSKPQRPGRQPNATEDQALDYLADAIRSTGHRPAKRTIARALGIHQATLDGWQRFKAAHRAAPPNPTWLRLFGRLKPAAEPQTPPAADAGTDRDKIPTEEAPAVVSHHDDRDKCIYEEARKGTAWERIASKVSNQGEWEPLTLQGCILAAKRYANRHRLPLPPPRKQGRPAAAK